MFNEQQIQIIKEKSPKIAVMAGAGVGKSTTLVGRIKEEVENGTPEHNITVITFTNEACDSLKEKLEKNKIDAESMTVKTLHGFCYNIYSKYCEINDYKRKKPISNNRAFFNKKFWALVGAYKNLPSKSIMQYLDFAFNCQIDRMSPEQYLEWFYKESKRKPKTLQQIQKEALEEKSELCRQEYMALMYYEYENLKTMNLQLDFTDMLNYAIDALEKCERTLHLFQRKIKSLYIDESQDTNALIIYLLSLLVTDEMKVVLLGDLRQSIYSFMNAVPKNILQYINDNNFKTMSLNKNYRSSQQIVDSANKFISNYPEVNIGGDLQCSKEPMESIVASYVSADENEEKHRVINLIQDLRAQGYEYKDIAILYRTNAQAMLLLDWVVTKDIPFVIKKDSASIFSRKEMKDIFTYLKLFNMPERCNVEDIRRIANKSYPPRYISNKAFSGIQDDSFGKALLQGEYDSDRILDKLSSDLAFHYKNAQKLNLGEQINYIATRIGYIESWTKTEANDSVFDITLYFSCLASLVKEFDTYPKLIKQVNKIKKTLKERNEEEGLNFYSCHGSKGLEFPIVILLGVCDRLYPFFRAEEERGAEGIAEEARIFYVASTRPIQHLYYSEVVGKFGRFNVKPSPFIKLTNRKLLTPYLTDAEPEPETQEQLNG